MLTLLEMEKAKLTKGNKDTERNNPRRSSRFWNVFRLEAFVNADDLAMAGMALLSA